MSVKMMNCPQCGKVFLKGLKDICPACLKLIDKMYEKCEQYLKENRGSTLSELSEGTEVSLIQITKFIREGRLSIRHSPNMEYPCEACGNPIREKVMCDNCRHRLAKDVNRLNMEDKQREIPKASQPKSSFQIRDRK